MKILLVLSALVVAALALPATPAAPAPAPAPSPAWRPSGRLLLLPARLENPTPTDTNNVTKTQQAQPDESQSARLLDSGEYYVLLPDGRLQMVKYTTAALTAAESDKQAYAQSQLPARVQEDEPVSKFQFHYLQFPSQVSQPQSEEEESAQLKAEEEAESGFEANVQYRDVKPISGPIYAYNPAPLVRVVRSQEH